MERLGGGWGGGVQERRAGPDREGGCKDEPNLKLTQCKWGRGGSVGDGESERMSLILAGEMGMAVVRWCGWVQGGGDCSFAGDCRRLHGCFAPCRIGSGRARAQRIPQVPIGGGGQTLSRGSREGREAAGREPGRSSPTRRERTARKDVAKCSHRAGAAAIDCGHWRVVRTELNGRIVGTV